MSIYDSTVNITGIVFEGNLTNSVAVEQASTVDSDVLGA